MAAPPDLISEAKRCVGTDPARAVMLARRILAAEPGHREARAVLGTTLRRTGDAAGALAVLAPLAAEVPAAWGMQYELGLTLTLLRRTTEAAAALRRAVALNPAVPAARHALADMLLRLDEYGPALAEAERLVAAQPGNPAFRALRGTARLHLGDAEGAIADFGIGSDAGSAVALGHALRFAGRLADAVAAYRRAAALRPGFGEAWWSLANLKTWRFGPDDIAAMTTALGSASGVDAGYLHFALGKAAEDGGAPADAFGHYARANALRRAVEPWDADATSDLVRRVMATFDASLFAARAGQGDPEAGPIFVVGMPRSGSTLVEQILASHSQVEGASELPDLPAVVRSLAYPEGVATADLAVLGRAYLERTRHRRGAGKPFFVDKLPGNFLHAGLIALILPNARIVDVRRNAMDCCWSLYAHAFAGGQAYAYDLGDLGRAYRDYVAAMAHFDRVLPGRVVRVRYDALVDAPEAEVRRLLDALGLSFEPGCLRFFETARTIRTPSSEQVRRPINRDGIGRWRPFAPWLEPLQVALGDLAPQR